MSRLVVANLDEVPSARPDWSVVVPSPGAWLLMGAPKDRQLVARWRRAAAYAVRAAGVPPLRSLQVVAEVRPNPPGGLSELLGRSEIGPYLRTADACMAGLRDVVGGPRVHPSLRWSAYASLRGGAVVLHITGEAR